MNIEELREKLAAKQKELAAVFAEMGPECDLSKVTSIAGTNEEKAAEIERRTKELTDIGEQLDRAITLKKAGDRVQKVGDYLTGGSGTVPHVKGRDEPASLGEYVVQSAEYKAALERPRKEFAVEWPAVELKTLFQTSAGFPPESTRTGKVVEAALLGPQVLDIIPSTTTTQASVVFMRETVTTEAAAERAEGAAYAEADISYAQDSSPVRSVGVSLPVTDEQLADVPAVRALIDGRLMLFLRRRIDRQVLVGDGIAPNLRGILNTNGIQTQAKGADPAFDAILKAMVKVQTTGAATPSAVILHPTDWQNIRLTRTVDGLYIIGNPADPSLARLWGVPVVTSDQLTVGTGLVGDFANHCELAARQGATVEVGFVNDNFTKGIQTIRAGVRVAFVVYRASAFVQVSGL